MIILNNFKNQIDKYQNNIIFKEWIDLRSKYENLSRYSEMLGLKINNLLIDMPDFKSFIWQYRDVFINESFSFKNKNDTPVIIDVGANIGLVSLYFAKKLPNAKIVSIEADPNVFSYLKKNIKQNNITNVECINAAAWSSAGVVYFESNSADAGHVVTEKKSNKTTEISSIDIAKVLESYDTVNLFKMDIEGGEFEVFPHIYKYLNKIENIILEVHLDFGNKDSLSSILQILEQNSFSYQIHPIYTTNTPLIDHEKQGAFDAQLNIYAYK